MAAASSTFRFLRTKLCSSHPRKLYGHQIRSRCFSSKTDITDDNALSKAAVAAPAEPAPRDPFPVFCQPQVQSLLANMTGFDLMKVAGPNIVPLTKPVYKLLTDQELAEEQETAKQRLKRKLQMPPFMNPRKPPGDPLSIDPDLAHFDTSKYVFADVTFGVKDRDRVVTVREIDGSLREASWDVKERLNQIYNPREGRMVITPKMFKEEHLERMIKEKKYDYILDRACCQFEPDDPDFIRTTRRVYSAVDQAGDHEMLWSSRHFGPMAFYLVWLQMADGLMGYILAKGRLSDAGDLARLYGLVHQSSLTAGALSKIDKESDFAAALAYIDSDSKEKDRLQLAIQVLKDSKTTNQVEESSIAS